MPQTNKSQRTSNPPLPGAAAFQKRLVRVGVEANLVLKESSLKASYLVRIYARLSHEAVASLTEAPR